jgi:hypothetical protein
MKKHTWILSLLCLWVFVSCDSNEPPGHITSIGLEKTTVILPGTKGETVVGTKEPAWAIGGIFVPRDNGEFKLYHNESYLRNGINHMCDTMVYEWVKLIKAAPCELKVVVEENPSAADRTVTASIFGDVGHFGAELAIIQKGR